MRGLWLTLVQWVYGRDRLGHDDLCDGEIQDIRARLAAWMLLKKKF